MLKVSTVGRWRTLKLEDLLLSLEEHISSLPSLQDLACILQRCRNEGGLPYTLRIHAYMRKKGLEVHPLLGNVLVLMLVEVGRIQAAQHVFNKLTERHEWSWNSLIAAYVNGGKVQCALDLYYKMQEDGSVYADGHTFVAILRACTKLKDLERGFKIHAEAARAGFLESNIFVGNALIDMYAKCGSLERAQKEFDKLPVRDVVSWNALLAGFMAHGHIEEAIHFIDKMQHEGVTPSAVTYVSSLKACGQIKATSKIYTLHIDIEKKGLLQTNLLVGTILVDMYAKCGLLDSAQYVFNHLPVQDAVSWTALIAGYLEQGYAEEAVRFFEKMQFEGVFPDMVTFLSSLKACGNIGATEKGIDIHAEIERRGLLERDPAIGTALVDMYGKCSLLSKAQQVFDSLRVRDVVSCNALMTRYAQLGQSENVSCLFNKMLQEHINPDPVTFIVVLSACSRRGLFQSSESFFDAMSKDHGIVPSSEHLACMIDLFSRAGQLDKAAEIMKKLQFCPNLVVWHSVLGACRKWGVLDFGKEAFEQVLQLDKMDGSAYVLMSHMYAASYLQK